MDNKTPKIIPIRKSSVVETLKVLLETAQQGKIKSFIASGFEEDGSVFIAVVGADPIEHHTLVSYLNANAIVRTVETGQY